jgi:acyl-CoA synthetase (AMP-forming)/AMP-acid ligase II
MTATLWHREPYPSLEETSALDMPWRRTAGASPECGGRRVEDKQFVAMAHAYRRSGGLASGDEVARLLRKRCDQPISMLARWIVDRSVVSFVWQSRTLLPMFQFERSNMSLCRGVSEVVQELSAVFDEWALATWFAQPNSWLHDAAPVDVIAGDPAEVLWAARADRFVARG